MPHFPAPRARAVLLAAVTAAASLVTAVAGAPPAAAYPTPNVEIDGHGFGHGRGMGQYGALGYALDHGWNYREILAHFYSNTGVGEIGNPEVTVILRAFDERHTLVQQERGHMTTNAAGGTFAALRARRTGENVFAVDSAPHCGGPWTEIRSGMSGPVVFRPQNRNEDRQEMLQVCEPDGEFRWVRGEIRAVERIGGFTQGTVNALDMQNYLRGVVPRESPASWGDLGGGAGMHALRAQAVAARSYAWAEDQTDYARTCDTDACQVYGGRAVQNAGGFFELEDGRSDQAIADTAGEVRILNGGVARTEFSSSTGGHTAGGTFPAVVDDGDDVSLNPFHNWHASIPVGQVEAAYPSVGTLEAVDVTRRNGLGDFGGRALDVQIRGSRGTVTRSGDSFAARFGLRSNWFAIAAPQQAPPGPSPGGQTGPPRWDGPWPIRPEPVLSSSPDAAAVRGVERVDVVARVGDQFARTTWVAGSAWTEWVGFGSPPGGAVGDPAVVSWGPGRLDVFARGADDRVWHIWSDTGGQTWSAWGKPFGDDNVLVASPEVSSRGPGLLDVFHVGTDGNLYLRFYNAGWNDHWIGLGQPPGGGRGEPAAASQTRESTDLFVRGADDKLWQAWWSSQTNLWSGWFQPLGGHGDLASSPEVVSWGFGHVAVFHRGTDSRFYVAEFGGGRWSNWTRVGPPEAVFDNTPGPTTRGQGRYDMLARGFDSRLYHLWR